MIAGPERLKVLSNRPIAPGHLVIEFGSARIARAARPGQFVQILTDDSSDPLLRRPFSFLDAGNGKFSILYQVVGRGTALLAGKKKGETLSVLGPLGNGWKMQNAKCKMQNEGQETEGGRGKKSRARSRGGMVLVGGGVGIPPLYHLAKTVVRGAQRAFRPEDIRVFLGAREKQFLHCKQEFKRLRARLFAATDDGSEGHRGFVTELLDDELRSDKGPRDSVSIYACGPTAMLRAVSSLARKFEVRCQVSVEEPMPCGFGACLGCAIKVRAHAPTHDRAYRYAMSCCEGPVFDAADILWE